MTDIMLVDDEVLALEYLKNMVDWERNGYHVVGCATSGKKALELFDRTHPQIVISDIRMPGTDGLELTRQIKEKDKETVVILALPSVILIMLRRNPLRRIQLSSETRAFF